ncbi:MAG: glutathione S-transferase family protein [Rhodospirillaceae bacterium]
MLELYNAAHSTCSQKVRLCLHEKGLSWKDHFLDLGKKDQLDPKYLKLNPNGVVPTLVHDGAVITDSSAICEYLDEVFPVPRLTPKCAVERAKMRSWMRYCEEVPTAAVRVPSFNMAFLSRFNGQDDAAFMAEEAAPRPIRKYFFQKMGREGFDPASVNQALEQLNQTASRISRALDENGGPWIMGAEFTLADIIVAPLIDRMTDLGWESLWVEFSNVTTWYEQIAKRQSFEKTFYPGSRLSEFLDITRLERHVD